MLEGVSRLVADTAAMRDCASTMCLKYRAGDCTKKHHGFYTCNADKRIWPTLASLSKEPSQFKNSTNKAGRIYYKGKRNYGSHVL